MAQIHYDMLRALLAGWTVVPINCYDEECIPGWLWTEPNGTEHTELGDHNELPTWPDSARKAIAKAEPKP